MNEKEAMQAYRGTILGDGNLQLDGGDAQFRMSFSDNRRDLVQRVLIPVEDLLEFLSNFVIEVLAPLGVKSCTGHPRVNPYAGKDKKGRWLPGVYLATKTSKLNTELYREYYSSGKKAIPEGFALTNILLARYFMLDGNSKWDNRGGPNVGVSLCTQGFDLHSVELFEGQLYKLGVSTGRAQYKVEKGAGIEITILAGSSDYFTSIVDPHVIPPYRYKIKYRGSCPPELVERYKKNRRQHNESRREWSSKRKEEQTKELFNNLKLIDNVRVKLGGGK